MESRVEIVVLKSTSQELQSRDQKVVLTASVTSAKLGVGHQTMAVAKFNS